jgi:hypothetical protein
MLPISVDAGMRWRRDYPRRAMEVLPMALSTATTG